MNDKLLWKLCRINAFEVKYVRGALYEYVCIIYLPIHCIYNNIIQGCWNYLKKFKSKKETPSARYFTWTRNDDSTSKRQNIWPFMRVKYILYNVQNLTNRNRNIFWEISFWIQILFAKTSLMLDWLWMEQCKEHWFSTSFRMDAQYSLQEFTSHACVSSNRTSH